MIDADEIGAYTDRMHCTTIRFVSFLFFLWGLVLVAAWISSCGEDLAPHGLVASGLDLSQIEPEPAKVTIPIEAAIAEAHRCGPCASSYDRATIFVPSQTYGCSEIRYSCLTEPCPAGTVCSAVGNLCWDWSRHPGCAATGSCAGQSGEALFCDHAANMCLEAYADVVEAQYKRIVVSTGGLSPSCSLL